MVQASISDGDEAYLILRRFFYKRPAPRSCTLSGKGCAADPPPSVVSSNLPHPSPLLVPAPQGRGRHLPPQGRRGRRILPLGKSPTLAIASKVNATLQRWRLAATPNARFHP